MSLAARGLLRHAVWVDFPARDSQRKLVESRSLRGEALDRRAQQALAQDLDQLEARSQRLALQEARTALEERVVRVDRGPELRDPFSLRGDGLHDRHLVVFSGKLEHLAQVADRPVGALAIRLVDAEQIRDLEDPRLDRLDVVAEPRHHHDHRRVRQPADFHFVLPDADGLHDDDVLAHRIENADAVAGRAGQSAELPARRQRADEDAGIERMVLHADAIAEDRAAGERARRIDGDDADGLSGAADVRDEAIDQRALPRAGIAGDADELRAPGLGEDRAQLRFGGGLRVVDEPHETRGGPDVTLQDAVGESTHQALSRSRAITSRWISLVPSPIVQSFTSR